MSLNIESGTLRAECLNAPNDVYIYFDSGFMVWNSNTSTPMGVWFKGEMFLLGEWKFFSGVEAAAALNEWVAEVNKVVP